MAAVHLYRRIRTISPGRRPGVAHRLAGLPDTYAGKTATRLRVAKKADGQFDRQVIKRGVAG
jgi:hypothetical protein